MKSYLPGLATAALLALMAADPALAMSTGSGNELVTQDAAGDLCDRDGSTALATGDNR